MGRPPHAKIVAVLTAIAILGTVLVLAPQPARADANAPRWTSGDFWLYVDANDANHTLRVEVVARESVRTLRGAVYDAWHVRNTETAGSIGVTSDQWITDDLGIVNSSVTIFFLTITTYEPPQPQAQFPLFAQKSWSVAVNVSVKIGNGGVNTFASTVSAQVDGETDVSVAAGTFHSFVIRTLGGGAYARLYYSDQAGYWSKKEMYNAQDQKTGEMALSSYRYQWNTTFLLIVVGLVLLAALAVIGFVVLRRRRARPPSQPLPPPPPPGP